MSAGDEEDAYAQATSSTTAPSHSQLVYYQAAQEPAPHHQQQHHYQQDEVLGFPSDLLEPAGPGQMLPHRGPPGPAPVYGYMDYGGGQPQFVEITPQQPRYVQVSQTNEPLEDAQWSQQYYFAADVPYAGTEEVVGETYQNYDDPVLAQSMLIQSNPFEEEDEEEEEAEGLYEPQQYQLQRQPPSGAQSSQPDDQQRVRQRPIVMPQTIHHPALLEPDDFDLEPQQPRPNLQQQQPQQRRVVVVRRDAREIEAEMRKRRALRKPPAPAKEQRPMASTASEEQIAQKTREQQAQRAATPEGWNTMNKWLKIAIEKDQRDQLIQHLETLKLCDVSVDLLQKTDTAKVVRELWKKHSNKKVNELANQLFTSWKSKVAESQKRSKVAKTTTKEKKAPNATATKPEKPKRSEEKQHHATDVNLLDKLTEAMSKESNGAPTATTSTTDAPSTSAEPAPNRPRTKAKVKLNKSRMTGLEEDAPSNKTDAPKRKKPDPKRIFTPSDSFIAAFDAPSTKPPPKKKPKPPPTTTTNPPASESTPPRNTRRESVNEPANNGTPPASPSADQLQKLIHSRRRDQGILRQEPLTAEEKTWRKIRFREANLADVRFFEVEAGERVNVSKINATDMKHTEMRREHDDMIRMKQQHQQQQLQMAGMPPLPGLGLGPEPDETPVKAEAPLSTSWRTTPSTTAPPPLQPQQQQQQQPWPTATRRLPPGVFCVQSVVGCVVQRRGLESTLALAEEERERNTMIAFVDPRVKVPVANENEDGELRQRAMDALNAFDSDPFANRIVVTRDADLRKPFNAATSSGGEHSPRNLPPLPFSQAILNLPHVPHDEDVQDLNAGTNSLHIDDQPSAEPEPSTDAVGSKVPEAPAALVPKEQVDPTIMSIMNSIRHTEVKDTDATDDLQLDLQRIHDNRTHIDSLMGLLNEPQSPREDDRDLRSADADALDQDRDLRSPDLDQDLRGPKSPEAEQPPTTTAAVVSLDQDLRNEPQPEAAPKPTAAPLVTTETLSALAALAGKTVGNLDINLKAILSQIDEKQQEKDKIIPPPVIQQLNDPTNPFAPPRDQPPNVYAQLPYGSAPPPAFGAFNNMGRPPVFNPTAFHMNTNPQQLYTTPPPQQQQQQQPPQQRPYYNNVPYGRHGPPLLCKFFMQGQCTYGDQCRHSHGPDQPTRFNNHFDAPNAADMGGFRGRGAPRGRGAHRWDDRRGGGRGGGPGRRNSPPRRFRNFDDRDVDRRRRRRDSPSPPRRRRFRSDSRSRSRSPPSRDNDRSRSPRRHRRERRTPSPPHAPTNPNGSDTPHSPPQQQQQVAQES